MMTLEFYNTALHEVNILKSGLSDYSNLLTFTINKKDFFVQFILYQPVFVVSLSFLLFFFFLFNTCMYCASPQVFLSLATVYGT